VVQDWTQVGGEGYRLFAGGNAPTLMYTGLAVTKKMMEVVDDAATRRTPLELARDVAIAAHAAGTLPDGPQAGLACERLCYAAEIALAHGLRESVASFFFKSAGASRLFDALASIPDTLPRAERTAALEALTRARNAGRSGIGRARALIRLTLTAGTLGEWLLCLAANVPLLERHYERWAVMCTEPAFAVITDSLSALKRSGQPLRLVPLVGRDAVLAISDDDYWQRCRQEVLALALPELPALAKPAELPPLMPSIRRVQALLATRLQRLRFVQLGAQAAVDAQALVRGGPWLCCPVRQMAAHAVLASALLRRAVSPGAMSYPRLVIASSTSAAVLRAIRETHFVKTLSAVCPTAQALLQSALLCRHLASRSRACCQSQSLLRCSAARRLRAATSDVQGLLVAARSSSSRIDEWSMAAAQSSALIRSARVRPAFVVVLAQGVVPTQTLLASSLALKRYSRVVRIVALPLQSLLLGCVARKRLVTHVVATNNLRALLLSHIAAAPLQHLCSASAVSQTLLLARFRHAEFSQLQLAALGTQAVARGASTHIGFLLRQLVVAWSCGGLACFLAASRFSTTSTASRECQGLLRCAPVARHATKLRSVSLLCAAMLHDTVAQRREEFRKARLLFQKLRSPTPPHSNQQRHTETIGGNDSVSLIIGYGEDDSSGRVDPEEGELALTAPGTRPVWVPNDSSTVCAMCKRAFRPLLNRKHHCRSCGNLVCAACTTFRPLPVLGYATPVRVCKSCVVRLWS